MEIEEQTESKINFVPCLRWVKRGVAKANPDNVQLTKDELVRIIKDTKGKLNITGDGEGQSSEPPTAPTVDDEFQMDKYDEDEETLGLQQLGIQSIAELPADDENFNDDDSDVEDDVIKPKDNLVLVGKVDGDASILEVYVYNEEEGSLYCHHDLLLPSFPLCIEWLDFEPGHPAGNYCAIGSMSPAIDIWDLDVVNCLEPAYQLGRPASRKKELEAVGHTDAVLDISWNPTYHHVLASGSVDQTILLWDIEEGKPSTKLEAFNEKVQCLKWHKLEAYTLLAGGCDNTAKVFDCRSDNSFMTWKLNGEAERIGWSPLQPYVFFVGTSTGYVQCFDCRQGELWSIQAHSNEVTGMSISEQCPGLLLTSSPDGSLKVWDFNETTAASLVHEKEFKMGAVHCLELCPDSPFIVAAGGDNKSHNFAVTDVLNIDAVKHHFGSRSLVELEVEPSAEVVNDT